MSSAESPVPPLEALLRGILPENPTYRQMLGMCPTLAVTATLAGALTMGLATTSVLVASNLAISALRHAVRPHLRILVFTSTIAAFVTVADRMLAAWLPAMSERLGPYVPLIIVNCILLCRAEACASRAPAGAALADAIGQGAGFTLGLSSLAVVRELLGQGSLLGFAILPASWPKLGILTLPAGAFFVLGLLVAASRLVARKGARP